MATAWPAAHDPITTNVTFAREIRAILSDRCAACHSRGGPAPMPLTTYDEVRPWARAIKAQVLDRRMPMWHAAHGYGAFANDPSLTPAELAAIASWVNGGMPKGVPSTPSLPSRPSPSRRSVAITIPASAERMSTRRPADWVTGWTFTPGDPLITQVNFRSTAGPIGTWVAGDDRVRLPAGSAIRVSGPIEITVQRRAKTDYEATFTPRRSTLWLSTAEKAPARRVWTESTACGAPGPTRSANVLAVRPLLGEGASARVALLRGGAPPKIVGWFRDFRPLYSRAYWLAQPVQVAWDTRFQADTSCTLELTLSAPRTSAPLGPTASPR